MIKEGKRLPPYNRIEKPPNMKFTERDGLILEAIHAFDGLLADYQIQRLFFSGKRQMQYRMSLLFQHGYVARPDRRRRFSLYSMVYWLDKKGFEYVLGLGNNNRLRSDSLKEPNWLRIRHDLAVNDFRIDLMEACRLVSNIELEEWIPQREFWAHPDEVNYVGSNGRKMKRRVRPDGFFSILSSDYRYRFLLEVDMATEDNPRFAREKVRPGIVYLNSKAFAKRFGNRSGRWLVVTTGERRMANMKRQTEVAVGEKAEVFYFTTFDKVEPITLLTSSIWYRGKDNDPIPLVP